MIKEFKIIYKLKLKVKPFNFKVIQIYINDNYRHVVLDYNSDESQFGPGGRM